MAIKKPRLNKNRFPSGFSLIELMVTVSIVGILAAIAVPNYQYSQAKARNFEAKANLAMLFTVESSVSLEQHSYSACLVDIGYTPVVQYYTVGLGGIDPGNCGPTGGLSCMGTYVGGALTACSSVANSGSLYALLATASIGSSPPAPVSSLHSTTSISGTSFIGGASGQISNGANYDQWTIDNNNNLMNVTIGY